MIIHIDIVLPAGESALQEERYVQISTQKWMDWYVYMQNDIVGNVRGCIGDPGPQGHWKITQIGDTGKCLLSTKQWPNWYMYMQDNNVGNVRGWNGDPGPQGHWIMEQKGTVIVNGQNIPTYVFYNEKWPNWYVYMQDKATGNVRGWNGDPGIQGYFVFKQVPYN